jgi:hypothetical protein
LFDFYALLLGQEFDLAQLFARLVQDSFGGAGFCFRSAYGRIVNEDLFYFRKPAASLVKAGIDLLQAEEVGSIAHV